MSRKKIRDFDDRNFYAPEPIKSEVYEYLKTYGESNFSDICEKLRYSDISIASALGLLRKEGLVVYVPKGRFIRFSAIEK